MKRVFVFVLSLLLMISALSSAEGFYGAVFEPGAETPLADYQAIQENGSFRFRTSLIPGWVFSVDTGEVENAPLTDKTLSFDLETDWTDALGKWIPLMNFTEKQGLFTCDVLSGAEKKKTADISWSDLMLLTDLFLSGREENSVRNELSELIRNGLMDMAADAPDLLIRTDLFEENNAFSASVLRGQDTLMTLSGISLSDSSFFAVLGNAEKGKTYYRTLMTEGLGTSEISMVLRGYADDRGAGYLALTEDALLSEETLAVSGLNSDLISFEFRYAMGPGSGISGSLKGEIRLSSEETFELEAVLWTGKNQDTEQVRILMSNAPEKQPQWPSEGRVYNPANAGEELTEELASDIQNMQNDWMTVLMKAVPVELLILILQ